MPTELLQRKTRKPYPKKPFCLICDEVNGCHIPRRRTTPQGYVNVFVNGKTMGAHCFCWEQENGPIPEGMVIDHIVCRNPACCNPDHLRCVTYQINNIENSTCGSAINAAKTRCFRGHEYSFTNTIIDQQGFRRCRACLSGDLRQLLKYEKPAELAAISHQLAAAESPHTVNADVCTP